MSLPVVHNLGMLFRDIFVLLFGVFIIFGAFGVTLEVTDPIVGLPWSALLATAAFIAALKFVSDTPTDRRNR